MKKAKSKRIIKTTVEKIRNNNFRSVYQHYQIYKQKYLERLADFDVQRDEK